MSSAEREIANNLKKIENKLAEEAAVLGEGELVLIEQELRRLQTVQQVSAAVDELRGTEVDLAAAQEELNRQIDAGNISLEQAAEAYKLLQDQALESQTTISAGWQRGLNAIGDQVTDLATSVETAMVNAFNSAEDALVDFVKTGKIDFSAMVDSMLADLTRLIIKLLIVKALEAFSGGGAPGAGSLGGGKADGGDVAPGTIYPVGEEGVELFAPSVPGQIIPNEKIAKAVGEKGGGRGPTPVTVILVSSKEEALAAMASTEGERIIVETNGKISRGAY